MNTVNKVTLLGNLVREPRFAKTNNGDYVCNATVATNEKQSKTQFTDIVLWAKSAELFAKLAFKGSRVYVEGVINTYTFDDSKQKTEVVVSKFIVLDTPNEAIGYNEDGGDLDDEKSN